MGTMNVINIKKISGVLSRYAILVFLAIIIVFTVCVEKAFFSPENIMNVLRQVSMGGIMALGMSFVLISGAVDLSVGAVMTLASCVLALNVTAIGEGPAIILTLLLATLLGTINGVLLTLIKGDMGTSFIITFGTKTFIYSLALIITGGFIINVSDMPTLSYFGKGMIGSVPFPVVLLGITAIACGFLLSKTPFGRKTYFVGSNMEAARLSGVNVRLQKTAVFALNGLCAGVAAIILVSRVGSAVHTMGTSYDFDVITMAVVGGVMLGGGKGSILEAFLGIIAIGIFTNAMNLLNVPVNPQIILKGILILFAVWVSTYSRRNIVEGK